MSRLLFNQRSNPSSILTASVFRAIGCSRGAREDGAVLVVGLLFLLLVLLVGITGIQNVALEERMTASSQDRNIAFQAAEAALRAGESVADAQSKTIPVNIGFPNGGKYTDADNTCPTSAINNCTASSGLCAIPDKDCPPRWKHPNFSSWVNASVSLGDLAGNMPQYFVEYLGGSFNCSTGGPTDPKSCKRYRITARSNPGAGRATVMLQSIYATE